MTELPLTPFLLMISRPTWKGERLTTVFPAASRLDWMMTFTVSMGWMVADAALPEMEPTRKGLAYSQTMLSFCVGDVMIIIKSGKLSYQSTLHHLPLDYWFAS